MNHLLNYSFHNHTVGEFLRSYLIISLDLLLAAAVLYFAERRFKLLSRFYNEERTAADLAVFRIALMSRYLVFPLTEGLHVAGLNKVLMAPPIGWSKFAAYIPYGAHSYQALSIIFLIFSVLSMVGLWTRITLPICIALACYLFTIPQLFGKVNHYHDLIIMGIILALSPCADALSVDAWLRRRKGLSEHAFAYSRRYGFPLAVVMTFIGLDYFFPGVWKVAHNGLHWFTAQNLHDLIAAQVAQQPSLTQFQVWVLGSRPLLFFGAFMTIVFEVGWIFAVLDRRTRPIAFFVGLGFHNFTKASMGIGFDHLQFCYAALVNWDSVRFFFLRLRGVSFRSRTEALHVSLPDFTRGIRTTALTIASLMIVTGFAGMVNSWPIACYPRFDSASATLQHMTSIVYYRADGSKDTANVSFDPQMLVYFPSSRWAGLVNSLGCSAWGYKPKKVLAFAQLWQHAKNLPDFDSVQLVCHEFDANTAGRPYLDEKTYPVIQAQPQKIALAIH